MDFLKKLCCGCLEEDEHGAPYERLQHDDIRPVRPQVSRRGTSNNGYEEYDGRGIQDSVSPPQPEKSVEERETEALNKILQYAQDSIIDVGHLHQGTLGTQDYIERAREYEQAMNNHEMKCLKNKSSPQHHVPSRRLLEDCGNKAADLLGRNTVTASTHSQVIENAARTQKAIGNIVAKPEQELLINMDF